MKTVLKLPFPPSVNHYWGERVLQRKDSKPVVIKYVTKKGKEYQKIMADCVESNGLVGAFKKGVFLQVDLYLFPPDRRERDIDNYTKALFDSMTYAKLWDDDSQVKKLHIDFSDSRENCLVIRVEKIQTQPTQESLI